MAREMKDSGIEWIGEIPKDWEVRKGKTLYNIQTGKLDVNEENPEGEYPFFTCSMYPQKIDKFAFDCEALLVAGNGLVGFAQYYNGKFNAYQRTYVLSKFNNVEPQYLRYYVTNLLPDAVERESVGSVISFIKLKDLQNFYVAMPNLVKQQEIAYFLDKKIAAFDNVFVKTRASVEEYKKLKQAVITQAVTKGIRGNREMKNSRSAWFGQIPSEWDMRKIKYIFKIQKDIAGEEGYTVLSITQKGIKPKDLSKNEGQLAENYSNYQLVHIGDFAMNHMDLLTGWVDVSKYEGVTSPDYRVFELIDKDNYYSKYYLYLMQMCYSNRIFYGLGQGVSELGRWRLQADKFLNFSITVPNYKEQEEIANYLDKKCSAIDDLIAKKEQYLAEIENYKNP